MRNIILVGLSFLIASLNSFAGNPEKGKTIFTSRCGSCHNVSKVVVGPALGGIEERRSLSWIVKFVQSSQSVIKGGDKEAVALFEKFNKIQMPDHKDLSVEDISNVMDFIKSEEKSTKAIPLEKAPKPKPANMNWTSDTYILLGVLAFLFLLLIGTSALLVNVKRIERENKQAVGS